MLKATIRLCKAPLSAMVAITALFGYFLNTPQITLEAIILFMGVFFVSCGAATLNSIQEVTLDGTHTRTKSRPLVTGVISLLTAKYFAIILTSVGFSLLYLGLSWTVPAYLCLLTLVIYNGVYTPLKMRTSFAVLPGGVVGALPPATGWLAAGSNNYYGLLVLAMSILFLWQIPHYFLVLLDFRDDYKNSNQKNITTELDVSSLKRITFIWIVAFQMSCIALASFPQFLPGKFQIFVIIQCLFWISFFWKRLIVDNTNNYKSLFLKLNLSLVIYLCSITAGNFLLY